MKDTAKRFVQIYTGNGKGKTTAAIGQAVRAAGHGLKSLIIMFMKNHPYGELQSLRRLSEWITVEQYGDDVFVMRKEPPSAEDIAVARRALARAREAVRSGVWDIVILDEVCVCVYFKLLAVDDILPLLAERPDHVELILTGRYGPQEWIEKADLVTELVEVKHYYQDGVIARRGFES